MEDQNKNLNQLDVENIEPIEGKPQPPQPKQKFSTIQEYLEKLLYPSLKIAISDLINEIKSNDYYNELENEFNHCFFSDYILFMDKGQIIEQGTHKELTELNGEYRKLVQRQLETVD